MQNKTPKSSDFFSRRVFMLGLITAACAPQQQEFIAPQISNRLGGAVQDISVEALQYTNDYRQRAGLNPLAQSSPCTQAAMHHALSMAMSDLMDHNVPDPRGLGQVVRRMKQFRVPRPHGENINYGYRTVKRSVDAWYGSTLHRQTMMNPHYHHAAIASATHPNSNNKVWYCGVYSV